MKGDEAGQVLQLDTAQVGINVPPSSVISLGGDSVFTGEGWATAHGESWRVRSAVPLEQGQLVRVTRASMALHWTWNGNRANQ